MKAILKTGETHSPRRGLAVHVYSNRSHFVLSSWVRIARVNHQLVRRISEVRSTERVNVFGSQH